MSTYAEERGASLKLRERKLRQRQRERSVRLAWMCVIACGMLLFGSVGIVAAGKMREVREMKQQSQQLAAETETEQATETERVRKPGPYPYHKPVKYSYTEALAQLEILALDYPEFEPICKTFEYYPGSLMVALANNPDMISFVEGYLESDGKANGVLSAAEKAQKVPHLLQWDKRWGYVAYGDDNIALSGCAPTCLAMVMIGLTGDAKITPDAVAEYASENGYYVEGTGTDWRMMTEGCLDFGIQGEILEMGEESIMTALEEGRPIICSMEPGDFTAAGHFIVLAGIEDGKIRVNDPNSKVRSEKLWDYSTLAPQIKGVWAFSKM